MSVGTQIAPPRKRRGGLVTKTAGAAGLFICQNQRVRGRPNQRLISFSPLSDMMNPSGGVSGYLSRIVGNRVWQSATSTSMLLSSMISLATGFVS
jgi:hypothetical protein